MNSAENSARRTETKKAVLKEKKRVGKMVGLLEVQ